MLCRLLRNCLDLLVHPHLLHFLCLALHIGGNSGLLVSDVNYLLGCISDGNLGGSSHDAVDDDLLTLSELEDL